MCGISGLLGNGWTKDQLSAMHAAQRHRGPDADGVYLDPDGLCGLAHNRLSIIDLSPAGRQPRANADGELVLLDDQDRSLWDRKRIAEGRVLVQRALSLVVSDEFDIRESISILFGGLAKSPTRRLVYEFVKERLDAILARMPQQAGPSLVQVGVAQCDAALKPDMEAVFKDRIAKLPGGPRVFAQAMERLDLCAQQRETQRPGVVKFLSRY